MRVPIILAGLLLSTLSPAAYAEPPRLTLATFEAEVTPPIGHACMGGGIAPVTKVDDPLFAKGFVLQGAGEPIVVVAVDWCEIRNDAYERWREALAKAAGTTRARVLVAALHQHDAPIADLTAQKLLDSVKARGSICDLAFHEEAVERVAKALEEGLKKTRPVTHIGTGLAKVEKVASNRRFHDKDGNVRFTRMSATRDAAIRDAEEGLIDPMLRMLSFWDGATPLLAMSAYATHPMSYYGKGWVSADFVGLARKRMQTDLPGVFQMYFSGCSGNVTAGKYNDGAVDNRPVLADRIYQGMKAAWKGTTRQPIEALTFRVAKLEFEPRGGPGFTPGDLATKLKEGKRGFDQCLAAFALSWRERLKTRPAVDVPALDWGSGVLTLLPAESYVEYQLYAQKQRPKDFVFVMGYGECAPGYIPTEKHWEEKDGNLSDWNWVAPGAQTRMERAIRAALGTKD
ncbi:MAG: hypothetical protein U0793_06080 [Gemmataceae bacterium]